MSNVLNNQRVRQSSSRGLEAAVKTFGNPTSRPARLPSSDNAAATVTDDTWLVAHDDPVASLRTTSACVALADLNNDGDYKLVVADNGLLETNMKLKIYKVSVQPRLCWPLYNQFVPLNT